MSSAKSVVSASTSSEASALSLASTKSNSCVYLTAAAKSGMFVKLHVDDGCDTAVDIPLKNLLKVNTNKESLSDRASYSILRHCALSTLFRYAPNRQIPYYANKNFITHFTYYNKVEEQEEPQNESESKSELKSESKSESKKFVQHVITNHTQLTQALDDAASKSLMDDNDNVILHIHCQYMNQYKYNRMTKGSNNNKKRCSNSKKHKNRQDQVKKLRQEATFAADHVVSTLKIWVQRATQFVQNHTTNKIGDDFVVVHGTAGGHGRRSKKDCHEYEFVSSKDHGSNTNEDQGACTTDHGMDWTSRFVQALLLPETIGCDGSQNKNVFHKTTHTISTPSSASISTSTTTIPNSKQLDQYEESVDAVAKTVTKGIKNVSKFLTNRILRRVGGKNVDQDDDEVEVLSLSPSPSLAESASLSCADDEYDNCEDEEESIATMEAQGVEIVFGTDRDTKSKDDCEEWKIFFGESQDDDEEYDVIDSSSSSAGSDELTLVDSPSCNDDRDADIISFSSSFAGGESSCSVKDDVPKKESSSSVIDNNDDDISWAMLSDDE